MILVFHCKAQAKCVFTLLLQVKARSAAREVIATYSVDDIFIELVIQLPQNYPLGSIAVESGRRVGVAVQQWRNWMLQLSTYLTHQVETQTPSGCKHATQEVGRDYSTFGWILSRSVKFSRTRQAKRSMKICLFQESKQRKNVNVFLCSEWQYYGGPGSMEEQCGQAF